MKALLLLIVCLTSSSVYANHPDVSAFKVQLVTFIFDSGWSTKETIQIASNMALDKACFSYLMDIMDAFDIQTTLTTALEAIKDFNALSVQSDDIQSNDMVLAIQENLVLLFPAY